LREREIIGRHGIRREKEGLRAMELQSRWGWREREREVMIRKQSRERIGNER
jgi:hypothetical protein